MRDVEAHVRAVLDARLNEWGARLDAQLYDEALTYLLSKAWELSGLDEQHRPRIGYRLRVVYEISDVEDDACDDRGWYASYEKAAAIAETLAAESPGVTIELLEEPPPGAYDPTLGLSFSTYSHRTLKLRVVDWYRSAFGDSRYGGRRPTVSLDAIFAMGHEADDGSNDVVDHFLQNEVADPTTLMAYDDFDDVLTNVALAV